MLPSSPAAAAEQGSGWDELTFAYPSTYLINCRATNKMVLIFLYFATPFSSTSTTPWMFYCVLKFQIPNLLESVTLDTLTFSLNLTLELDSRNNVTPHPTRYSTVKSLSFFRGLFFSELSILQLLLPMFAPKCP